MGHLRNVEPGLLVVACFSRHGDAISWATDRLVERFGPLALSSPDYDFHHTSYYEKSMGAALRKRLLVFDTLFAPDGLASAKSTTNQLEHDLASEKSFAEPRPLNLDPGVLHLGKFLLASTKDQSHRIYLRDNIFAEVTLRFENDQFEPWPWTYADYREPFVREFLRTARGLLYHKLRR